MSEQGERAGDVGAGVAGAGGDHQALNKALHAERTEANSLHVDCWACEASQSKTMADLLRALRLTQGERDHANALIGRLVPDEEDQMNLWRDYWRGKVEALRSETRATNPASSRDG